MLRTSNSRILQKKSDFFSGAISEAFMNMGSNQRGGRGATPRGSTHRTSFIEYVSEVYNSRTAAAAAATGAPTSGSHPHGGGSGAGNHLEALSVRGHGSISSGSVASGCSTSLARDLSVRSENVHCNRVLSFTGPAKLQRDMTKSARLAPGNPFLLNKNIWYLEF